MSVCKGNHWIPDGDIGYCPRRDGRPFEIRKQR
jgi:hypothetical protein